MSPAMPQPSASSSPKARPAKPPMASRMTVRGGHERAGGGTAVEITRVTQPSDWQQRYRAFSEVQQQLLRDRRKASVPAG